jgi:hypothetical protein
MANKPVAPGDLVFVNDDYLDLIYSDAFNHKHSALNRPFLVLGKHKNCPGILILSPVSSKFYYNYCKLEKRTSMMIEELLAPSVVLISNNALHEQGFFNGAVLLDQSIAAPVNICTLYRTAFKDYTITNPRPPVKPYLVSDERLSKKALRKYESALMEWNRCTDTSLFLPKVNINWFVTNGKNAVRHLSKRGKMEIDINLSLGCAFAYSNPKLLEY